MKPIDKFINRILLGDCVTAMRQMPEESVDLIVTDPPYICRFQARDGRTVANDDQDDWLMPAFTQMYTHGQGLLYLGGELSRLACTTHQAVTCHGP